ncbi:NUDIX hydrolase N-terminal domain-containing protein [Candidatus Poriferisocius sp.]|uniref:NUDIX hydrolase N-terminal domain-containing protein n=1 Tax=Candidatus Poriferisocius sp. TaxID=3101276 RepID=UPI003B5234A1
MNDEGRPVVGEDDLRRWSEALAGIARTGLAFTDNQYEQERFEEVLHVAADMAATLSTGWTPDNFVAEWMKSVGDGVPGYVTPKVAVGAVVGNDDGEILLVQRADSGVWLYPTGWADVGYSPSEVVVKEVLEETGIQCEVERPIAIHDGLRRGFTTVPMYSMVFLCRAVGGQLDPHPLECRNVGFFGPDNLPDGVQGSDWWLSHSFAAIRGEPIDFLFDHPRTPPWRDSHPG